jgi:hypothetical protein
VPICLPGKTVPNKSINLSKPFSRVIFKAMLSEKPVVAAKRDAIQRFDLSIVNRQITQLLDRIA